MAQAVPSPPPRLDGVQPHLAPAAVLESRVGGHLSPHLDGLLRFCSWHLLNEDLSIDFVRHGVGCLRSTEGYTWLAVHTEHPFLILGFPNQPCSFEGPASSQPCGHLPRPRRLTGGGAEMPLTWHLLPLTRPLPVSFGSPLKLPLPCPLAPHLPPPLAGCPRVPPMCRPLPFPTTHSFIKHLWSLSREILGMRG